MITFLLLFSLINKIHLFFIRKREPVTNIIEKRLIVFLLCDSLVHSPFLIWTRNLNKITIYKITNRVKNETAVSILPQIIGEDMHLCAS